MQHADADAYLALAVDCLRKARHEDSDSWMYEAIANAWMKLADRVDPDDAEPEGPEDTTVLADDLAKPTPADDLTKLPANDLALH